MNFVPVEMCQLERRLLIRAEKDGGGERGAVVMSLRIPVVCVVEESRLSIVE